MLNDYNIPKGRAAKIAVLQAIMEGKMTIDDLKKEGYEVEMWRPDETNPSYLISFDGSKRIAVTKFEEQKRNSKATFITLNLNT